MLKIIVGATICVLGVVMFMLSTTKADPLQVGTEAPKMNSIDQDGKHVNLTEILAKGVTLVYFYPKADTPGCTKQACTLGERWKDVETAGIKVIGVSMDKPDAQKAFKEKYKLPFTLLADSSGDIVKAFGVPMFRAGLATRQSFLVKDGKIVWHDPAVDPGTHLENVLKQVSALKR